MQKAFEYLDSQLSLARELNYRRPQIHACGNLARAYGELGEWQRSVELHEQCLALAREDGDRRTECKALCNLAFIGNLLGENSLAIDRYENQNTIHRLL